MAEEAEAIVEDLEPSTDAAAEGAAEDEGEVILEGLELSKAAKPPAEEASTEDAEKAAEKPGEKPEPKAAPEEKDELAELREKVRKSNEWAFEMQKALAQARKINRDLKEGKKGKQESDEDFLTDAQIKAILDEHGHDTETMIKVVNHQARREALKARNEFKNDLEVHQAKERFNNFLQQEWPEALKEDSEVRPQIEKAVSDLRLDGHPLADFLAASAFFFTNWKPVSEKIREEARKEALGEKAETVRKEVVKKTGLTAKTAGDKKPAAGPGLPANLEERAKQMGLNARQKKFYAQLVKGGTKISVQAGA